MTQEVPPAPTILAEMLSSLRDRASAISERAALRFADHPLLAQAIMGESVGILNAVDAIEERAAEFTLIKTEDLKNLAAEYLDQHFQACGYCFTGREALCRDQVTLTLARGIAE